jgi:hypothetical protein
LKGKIRATLKKESQLKKMKKVASVGMTSGATNGLSSSLVFTPVSLHHTVMLVLFFLANKLQKNFGNLCHFIRNLLYWITRATKSTIYSILSLLKVQGLELVNPNAAMEKVKEANAKWFNSQSGFLSAAPK